MNREWTRNSLLVGALAATLSLVACGDNRNSANPPSNQSTAPSDRVTADATSAMNRAGNAADRAAAKTEAAGDKAANAASDAATTAKVKSRLMAEPGIDSLEIDVDTSNGRVTLTGDVDTPQHRARAKELASSVEGVNGVVDRMAVRQ